MDEIVDCEGRTSWADSPLHEKVEEHELKQPYEIARKWASQWWTNERLSTKSDLISLFQSAIDEATEALDAWLPIDTAPKDGTRILIYQEAAFRPFEHSVAKWDEADGCWYTMPTRDYRLCCQPLGWRPLPDPPREGGVKYRKKPVVIEAFQMTHERRVDNSDWPYWMRVAWNEEREAEGSLYPTEAGTSDGTLSIGTLEGQHLVSWGDWIIRGVNGEIYPCKPDIFIKTYEAAEGGEG